jgi:phage replication-related protein YjqB (UPF0714/DUF867 family)
MADLYANYADLAAHTVQGVDYRIDTRYNRSSTISIAIHGGSIESGTTEAASALAAYCRHNDYSFVGIRSANNSDLHITSTHFDEPTALNMVGAADYCFSFHGMSDITSGVPQTYVGGLDTVNRDAVISALTGAGFTATVGTAELDGSDPANITNKTRRQMGVQLEMSTQQRKNFFTSGDFTSANRNTGVRTEEFYRYIKAVASVANNLGGGASQTTQYDLNLVDLNQGDYISDVETWINYNWEKLRKATAPISGTTLPQSGPFNIGDRFYKTDTKSIYVLACKDANWGWFWRPVHDAISPWIQPPSTCMAISGWNISTINSLNPFAIALDNRGRVFWRGVIGVSSGTFARGQSFSVFKPLPNGIRPRQKGVYMLGHEPCTVGSDGSQTSAWQGARIFISDDPTVSPTIRGFGGSADFSNVYMTGVQYAAGIGKYWSV